MPSFLDSRDARYVIGALALMIVLLAITIAVGPAPAPQSLGPVPAVWQVVWPLGTTFHPWAFSCETAVDGL